MRRRITWRYGDSAPVFGHLIVSASGTDVLGDGELKIVTSFPVSAAEVAFSKIYNRYLVDAYGYDYQNYAFAPECYVKSVDDDGFTICYANIPDTLDINYFVM